MSGMKHVPKHRLTVSETCSIVNVAPASIDVRAGKSMEDLRAQLAPQLAGAASCPAVQERLEAGLHVKSHRSRKERRRARRAETQETLRRLGDQHENLCFERPRACLKMVVVLDVPFVMAYTGGIVRAMKRVQHMEVGIERVELPDMRHT